MSLEKKKIKKQTGGLTNNTSDFDELFINENSNKNSSIHLCFFFFYFKKNVN